MNKKANGPDLFKVEDFVIFCGSKKFEVTLKTKKGVETVLGEFIRRGKIVHLLVEIGTKKTLKPKYQSFGPKTIITSFCGYWYK